MEDLAGLKNLKLVNTTLLHHPDMQLPPDLHLDTLTAYVLGKSTNVLPVELLKRTKQVALNPKPVLHKHPLPSGPSQTFLCLWSFTNIPFSLVLHKNPFLSGPPQTSLALWSWVHVLISINPSLATPWSCHQSVRCTL